jgi:Tfp pilus assembly protein PilF
MEYRKRGAIDRAIELLEQGISKDPDYANMTLALAHFLRRSDPARSRKLVEKVLAKEPENPGAQQLLKSLNALKK